MADQADNIESEIWKDIPGWDGYQASSMGRIRAKDRERVQRTSRNANRVMKIIYRGKVRKPSICPQTGYLKVGLGLGDGRRKTMAVHLLVALAFHGPRPDRHDVAHNDGDRLNPKPGNLRWATRKENRADCKLHGTNNHGERNGQAKLTADQVRAIRVAHTNGTTPTVIGKQYGLNPRHVCDIVARRRWEHLE